jgi:5-methylcytosine-specific restriction endonuclease McrA
LCGEEFTNKDMNVDHIDPVVDPVRGFEGWDTFIDRLFCERENLQAICVPCHKEKSKAETQARKKDASK